MELSESKSAYIRPELKMFELDLSVSILQGSNTSSTEDVLDGVYL